MDLTCPHWWANNVVQKLLPALSVCVFYKLKSFSKLELPNPLPFLHHTCIWGDCETVCLLKMHVNTTKIQVTWQRCWLLTKSPKPNPRVWWLQKLCRSPKKPQFKFRAEMKFISQICSGWPHFQFGIGAHWRVCASTLQKMLVQRPRGRQA